MRNILAVSGMAIMVFISTSVLAGNPDRNGQAGASELLFNPWAVSSGFNSMNTANVTGAEAMRLNVAGLAFTEKTELIFANSTILKGADLTSNAFAFGQKVGESGVIGISMVAMGLGDIDITTVANPDGGIGSYKPQYLNIGLGYSKAFSNSIYGGFVLRGISESISNVNALGMAIDAGIQYVAGAEENIHFGISLRNIGVPMRYSGDGLSFRGESPNGNYQLSVEQLSARFELPSLMHIGFAYDFNVTKDHRITAVGNFTSNSFTPDQIGAGVEYGFRDYFMVRAGYTYEEGIGKLETRSTAYTGLGAGFSVKAPLKKKDSEEGPTVALDYSYRDTNPFQGTHTIGMRIIL